MDLQELIGNANERDSNTKVNCYGMEIQENAINLLAQLAIRKEKGITADEIINGGKDISEKNNYKKTDILARLLAVSMQNDFEEDITFENLIDKGLDGLLTMRDGKKEPINTFFYGLLNDSCIIENEFDKYTAKGEWRKLCEKVKLLQGLACNSKEFNNMQNYCKHEILLFAKKRILEKYSKAQERNKGKKLTDMSTKINNILEIMKEQGISQEEIER